MCIFPSPHHPCGHGPQTGPSKVSRHSTSGKHIGGLSPHSGFFIWQALQSSKASLRITVAFLSTLTFSSIVLESLKHRFNVCYTLHHYLNNQFSVKF